jgi:hemerythrin
MLERGGKMAFIEWNDTLSVKVEKFNRQHRSLIKLLNELHEAMVKGRGKDMLDNTLAGLIDYAKTHFKDEEVEMEKHAYPDFEIHKAEHNKLTDKVLEFHRKYQSGEKYISIEVLTFLKDWLVFHIMRTDKMYGDYYESNKITIE